MAKTFTATIPLTWDRVHRCCNCHSEYSYRIERSVSAQGPTEEAASTNLVSAVASFLKRKNEICDVVACPVCGYHQPEMFLEKYRGIRWLKFMGGIAALIFLLFLTVAYFELQDEKNAMSGYVMVVWCGRLAWLLFLAPLFIYLGGIWGCSNRNLQQNLEKTQKRENIVLLNEETPPEPEMAKKLSRSYLHVFWGSLLLVLFAILIPLMHKAPLPKDAANSDCLPKYFGPGDPVRVYFPIHVSALKGYWDSNVNAVLDAEGLESKKNVAVYPHHSSWGDRISGKRRELTNSSRQVYTDIVIPKENIEGKNVTISYKMTLRYPTSVGRNEFVEQTDVHTTDMKYRLSTAGIGTNLIYLELYSLFATMGLYLCHLFLPGFLIRSLRNDIEIPNFVMPENSGE